MFVRDHINLQGSNPLIGPNDERFGVRFPDMTQVYWKPYRESRWTRSGKLGMRNLAEGVYAGALRAELRNAGGNSLLAHDWRGPGGHVHRAGSDRRAAHGNSRAGNFLRDEHGRGNSASSSRRRSYGNRRAREGRFLALLRAVIPQIAEAIALSENDDDELIAAAKSAREHAHAPFSNFRVGAAVRAKSGRIFSGCNVENATYGLTLCAERVAIFKAISRRRTRIRRHRRRHGYRCAHASLRRVPAMIWEFCGDAEVILANLKGKSEIIPMKALFPRPFDAGNL